MTQLPASPHRSLDARALARVAVFAAIIVVLGLPGAISVWGSVPITAQTLGVMLAGAILGPWLGALSVTLVIALVAIGAPVLAGGRGGVAVFVSPTAGYLFGWIAAAIIIGLIVHAAGRRPVVWRTFTGMVVGGVLALYVIGIPVQSLTTRLPLDKTVLASLAFIPGDLVKAVLATAVVMVLVRAYPRAFARNWSRTEPSRNARTATA